MVTEKVQDRATKSWDDAEKKERKSLKSWQRLRRHWHNYN
jgi:hypothetical protein